MRELEAAVFDRREEYNHGIEGPQHRSKLRLKRAQAR